MTDTCPYDVFLRGENVNLVIPNEAAVEEGRWHQWFNDPDTNRYLAQGSFPTTPQDQRRLIEASQGPNNDRLLLLIWATDPKKIIGVTSLSHIDMERRTAQQASIIGDGAGSTNDLFYPLETKAMLTVHAFETMGLERISGTQSLSLEKWQKFQMLLGYRTEGIQRRAFRKGLRVEDVIMNACTLEDYLKIKELRNGEYWPGREKMLELIRSLPKESPVLAVRDAIDKVIEDYHSHITWN